MQRGTSVIPKATSPDRIKENFGALSFELNAEQMEKLSVLDYQACAPPHPPAEPLCTRACPS